LLFNAENYILTVASLFLEVKDFIVTDCSYWFCIFYVGSHLIKSLKKYTRQNGQSPTKDYYWFLILNHNPEPFVGAFIIRRGCHSFASYFQFNKAFTRVGNPLYSSAILNAPIV